VNNEADALSADGKKNVVKIAASVRKMELLISDILILTRMNAYETPPSKVNINDVLELVKDDMRACIEETGAEIKADYLPTIMGHEKQIFQLMKNLVQNALKFCKPEGIPDVRITTNTIKGSEVPVENARAEINYIVISVADNGTGIERKYTKKVFQMFQKLHSKSDADSTGAGLFICKKVMENHGGLIGFTSESGKGSVFSCYFPVS
jgi:signal transduction histidine kinase